MKKKKKKLIQVATLTCIFHVTVATCKTQSYYRGPAEKVFL